jgi:DNA-binding ferritin-like protein
MRLRYIWRQRIFIWHVSGPHFRDYHLLLDEQGDQIFVMTDELAERVRKIGGTTLRSIGHVAKLQRIDDNDADFVAPADPQKTPMFIPFPRPCSLSDREEVR